tara:strand:+ start:988 stop:1524 length:537 start_codon:yes stop_codon:yes gene_type:complete
MTIKIKVKDPVDAVVSLHARKTLDGDLMIFDHPEIDIIISPTKGKVLSFSKTQYGDHIYATQSRFFEFLARKGVIDKGSVHSGNIYGSLEGAILESVDPETVDSFQVTIYSVAKFLLEEKPYYDAIRHFDIEEEKELLEPGAEESTELGEVPHDQRKGVSTEYAGYNAAFGLYGIYEE